MGEKWLILNNQNVMNNLGGWKKVELLFLDEVDHMVIGNYGVVLNNSTKSSLILPHHAGGINLVVTSKVDSNGCLYTHSCSVELRSNMLTNDFGVLLHRAASCGCLLIGTNNNGESYLFGDKDTPLIGTYGNNHGKQASDLNVSILSVSTTSVHPELSIM